MYSNWEDDYSESGGFKYLNLVIFVAAAALSIVLFLNFHPQIVQFTEQSPLIINILFLPAFGIGFLYGLKLAEKTLKPSEIRSPIKRSIAKVFLFFFVIGGMFSAVSFAMEGGRSLPVSSLLDVGLFNWVSEFVKANGGTTFLIISSISIMAAATKRIVGLGGFANRVFTFVSTFVFFFMIAMSFTHADPTRSEIYLYTFYQAGIIGGVLYQMNRFTKNLNAWEDFANGYR